MLRKIMLCGIFLILLSACSSNELTFNGETDNWSAVLKVTQHSNDYEDREFELHYKGDDVNSVENISFDVDTNAGGFSGGDYTLDENGVIKSSSSANPTNAKVSENSEVEVTIEWNGNTEKIILTNN